MTSKLMYDVPVTPQVVGVYILSVVIIPDNNKTKENKIIKIMLFAFYLQYHCFHSISNIGQRF